MIQHIFITVLGILWILIASVQTELRHLIESPKATNWGTWGEVDRCPTGTFATGMQLKVEGHEGWKDDTGLNGIKFFCSELREDISSEEMSPEVITSSVGPFGEWKNAFYCRDDDKMHKTMSAVVGFQLRSEPPKGSRDDTSANNLRIICADFSETSNIFSSVIEGDGTSWGSWTDSQFCKQGYAVCGIVTQVDHGKPGSYDDTSLNNVKAECCKIEFSTEDEHPRNVHPNLSPKASFPDPIESARNLEKEIHKSISKPNPIPIPPNHSESEPIPDKVILSFSPEVVYEVTEKIQRALTDPGQEEEMSTNKHPPTPSELDHALASHEINRLADLDFGTPDITVTVKIINENENSSSGPLNSNTVVQTDMPPAVIHFLKAEDNDEDPRPSQVNVIAGRINQVDSAHNLPEEVSSLGANSESQVHQIPHSVSSSSICIAMPFLCLCLLFIKPAYFTLIF